MKKVITGLLVIFMILALAACAGDNTPDGSGETTLGDFDSSKEINLVTREPGSGTRSAFVELFEIQEVQDDGSKKDIISEEAAVENNTNSVLVSVQNDLYAIGYVSMGSLNENVKAVSIEGIAANKDNVKNGTYPISRPFMIATKAMDNALVADFIGFILSKEGQEVAAHSYIAVDESAAPYSGSTPAGSIVVGGSSSVAPLMEKLIEAYALINTNADIELQVTDSSTGMNNAMEGTYDIGMASRELKEAELEVLEDTQIALDGIAVIVHLDNPVANLTKEQVKDIYTGQETTWESFV